MIRGISQFGTQSTTIINAKMTGSLDWMLLDRPLNTLFESLSHTKTILQGLNELRRQEYLLDITLLAEGQSFKVCYCFY